MAVKQSKCNSRDDIQVFNLLKRPVWVFDVQRKEMWWANEAALEVWGAASLSELLARDFKSDLTEATELRMNERLDRVHKGEIFREQWTFYPNGKAQTVLCISSPITLDDGRPAILAEAEVPDIKDFDASTTRGIELFRHVSVAVCEFSLQGIPIFRNSEDLKMLGSSFLDRFVDKELGKRVLVSGQKGEAYDIESEQKLANGTTRWFAVSVRNGKDPISGDRVIIYSGRDITEIVQARKDSTRARLKSEFLSVIAHELRTPLHQVIGYADLLELSDLSNAQLDSVRLIQKSTESLMAIINDLLDYTKLEEGKVHVSSINFSLRGALKGCLAAVQAEATLKGLTLKPDFPSNLPKRIIGDPHKLRQILLNLLENAVKFTLQGEVSFRVIPTKLLHGKTQWLRFEVQDTGIGIDKAHQSLIFEKYQQIHMDDTRPYDGTGLGLAICKSVSEAMGGKIGVTSTVGKGSCFSVELPFTLPTEQGCYTPVHSFHLMAVDEPLQVLIVEDNEVNRKMAKRMLEKMGHTALLAENGQIALDILTESHSGVDLVLMDVQMPVMDGIECTKQIRRRLKKTKHALPVIGLTASFQHADLKYYMGIGMNTCLGKPIRLDDLKRAFESVASRCASGLYSDDGDETKFGCSDEVGSTFDLPCTGFDDMHHDIHEKVRMEAAESCHCYSSSR